jgi:ring-1,2-phenylacetyl-CoA epoxidase subunit PaaE
MNAFSLTVVEKRIETEDAVTVCFKQPGLKKVKYIAGQYLTLIFRINGRRYIRPYSFSSCPQTDALLEITIKRVTNGMISNYILDEIMVGDTIQAMPPMGDFVYQPEMGCTSVYLWGVGSGITPLISMAKSILTTNQDIHVHLIYGNRTHESTIFLKKIKELQQQYGKAFKVKLFYTTMFISEDNPNIIQGRIDQNKAMDILKDDLDLQNSTHYICGPIGLKESVKNALTMKGISSDRVFSEDFELVKDPKDFENIHSQEITLRYQDSSHQLIVVKGKSILEAALEADIELPYSCQTGSCSTCKGLLISGDAKMIGLSHKRDDLTENEYLLCCSHPLSSNVVIEI